MIENNDGVKYVAEEHYDMWLRTQELNLQLFCWRKTALTTKLQPQK